MNFELKKLALHKLKDKIVIPIKIAKIVFSHARSDQDISSEQNYSVEL